MNAIELQRLISIRLVTKTVASREGPKLQITCNDAIKNFQKRKFLWNKDIVEQRYCRFFCAAEKIRSRRVENV